MKTTKVILKETIEAIGVIGSLVNVARGYARNYLLPYGKAVLATASNLNLLTKQRMKIDLQIAKERSLAEELAKRLVAVECKFSAKVSEEGRLYGSVSSRDIADYLISKDINVDRRQILLKDSIKEPGIYKVPIRIYQGVEPKIVVEVVPE